MSFAQENGYTPPSFEELVELTRAQINIQFSTAYTAETFVGTNWYKYAYALLQRVQENEIKTSEIFQKLQEYISETNERIQRPSVSAPGLLDSFEAQDIVVSVKPPLEADAGKIFICVDLDDTDDDYEDQKTLVAGLIKDYVAGGIVSQGTEETELVLTNGQAFTFKFNLPTRTPILLRLSANVSENNLLVIPSDETLRQTILTNVRARYRLGWDFEPQRYFGLSDALWASNLVLEWSDNDGADWNDTVFTASYTDLFTFGLEDISVVLS